MFLYYRILKWFIKHNVWLRNQPVKYERFKIRFKWNKRAKDEEICFLNLLK